MFTVDSTCSISNSTNSSGSRESVSWSVLWSWPGMFTLDPICAVDDTSWDVFMLFVICRFCLSLRRPQITLNFCCIYKIEGSQNLAASSFLMLSPGAVVKLQFQTGQNHKVRWSLYQNIFMVLGHSRLQKCKNCKDAVQACERCFIQT